MLVNLTLAVGLELSIF